MNASFHRYGEKLRRVQFLGSINIKGNVIRSSKLILISNAHSVPMCFKGASVTMHNVPDPTTFYFPPISYALYTNFRYALLGRRFGEDAPRGGSCKSYH